MLINEQYSTNGPFGKVRLCEYSNSPDEELYLFCSNNVGWHTCNSNYIIDRTEKRSYYTILVSVKGAGTVQLNDTTKKMTENNIAILPPEDRHKYYVAEGDTWEFYFLHITANHARVFLDRTIATRGNFFKMQNTNGLVLQLEELIYTKIDLCSSSVSRSQIISGIMHEFVKPTCSKSENTQNEKNVLSNAINYIELNYQHTVNFKKLSESLFTSVTHLIRIFKKNTGLTPHQYLEQYRMLKACRLLLVTPMSVTEIAGRVGYNSTSNFIARFKLNYNATPAEYRSANALER